jgi:hypothetical protein
MAPKEQLVWTADRRAELEQALRSSRTRRDAARKMNLGIGSLDHACGVYGIKPADLLGSKPAGEPVNVEADLRRAVKDLRSRVRELEDSALTDERVRREIIGLTSANVKPPGWLVEIQKAKKGPGVPTAYATDWHWWEVVDPGQIGGVNRYDKEIAHARARAFFTNTVDLLTQHMVRPDYPGIVLPLGGDMLSGDIHEELTATNEGTMLQALLDLFGVLSWGIDQFAGFFGNVFVPCVTGNHGRLTMKIRMKGRAHTSLDWLLYQMLAKRFEGDKRVAFQIADGPDALYQIHGHRYLLTHGDMLGKGGDGIIGALGPILRGDTKRRSRNAQIDQAYDTLVIGHWHQLIQMQRVIVGGTLKGYDEFASTLALPYEPPRQALWITHPEHGLTLSMPVIVERQKARRPSSEWVAWSQAA